MALVFRQQRGTLNQGSARDQEIHRGEGFALPVQRGVQLGVCRGEPLVCLHHRQSTTGIPDPPALRFAIRVQFRPDEKLAEDEEADGELLAAVLRKPPTGGTGLAPSRLLNPQAVSHVSELVDRKSVV